MKGRRAEFVNAISARVRPSDTPMLNAFCRVGPSDRFIAILAAGVFLRASDLSSRT